MGDGKTNVLQLCCSAGCDGRALTAIVDHCHRLSAGDAEREFHSSLAFIRRGRQVATDVIGRAGEFGIDCDELLQHGPFDPTLPWRLGMVLRRRRIDVVHAHDATSHLLAMFLQPLFRFSMVATARSHVPTDWKARLKVEIDQKILPGFHRVIAANRQLANQLCGIGCRASQVDVIHGSVDTENYSRHAVRGDLRRDLKIPRNARVIGTIARGATEAELRFVFAARRWAEADLGPICLLVLDETPNNQIGRLAAEFDAAGGTYVVDADDRLPRTYAAIDVFVATGSSANPVEGILEAQSMEVPVVCGNFFAVDEVISNGTTGLVVDADDSISLGDAICRLLKNRPEAASMAVAGRLRICQSFRTSDSIAQMARTYRRAMADA